MKRTNLESLNLIIIYLLRSPSFIRLALPKLKAEHFYEQGVERVHRCIYSIASRFFSERGQLPNREVVLAELADFLAKYPGYLGAEQLAYAQSLIACAWDKAYDQADAQDQNYQFVRSRLAEFLAERNVSDQLQSLLENGSDIQVGEMLQVMQQKVIESQLVDIDEGISPMAALSSGPVPQRVLTGAAWFDYLSGGGLLDSGGELIGYFGGTGYGKTTAVIHIATAMAKRGRTVFYFSYEQAVSDKDTNYKLLHKAVSAATGIPTKDLERGVDFLTDQQRMILDRERTALDANLKFFDMTGYQNKTGFGGIAEIEPYLARASQQGKRVPLVIIDWFGELRNRKLGREPSRSKADARSVTNDETQTALVLAVRYKTNFLIVEQASTQAIQKKPGARLDVTDVQEAKNLAHRMHMFIGMGQPTAHEGYCTIECVKGRHVGRRETTVQYQWETNNIVTQKGVKFDSASKMYVSTGAANTVDEVANPAPARRANVPFLTS